MKNKIVILTAVLGLAGCMASPEPDYFALAAVPGATMLDVTYVVKIQRPFLAGYLDRPYIVSQNNAYRLQIDEQNRWAEPLDTMFERILTQDLRMRLPAATVIDEDSGGSSESRVTIALDLQQFNISQGQAVLQAQLNLKDKGTHEQPLPQPVQYKVDSGSSASSMAENLSLLAGRLADDVAQRLHARMVQSEASSPIHAGPPADY